MRTMPGMPHMPQTPQTPPVKPSTELAIYKLCGDAIAHLDCDDISNIKETHGDSVKALKLFLSHVVGLSRFRQKLMHGTQVLQDADPLSSVSLPASLQLVMLPFVPASRGDLQCMRIAAESGQHLEMQRLLEQHFDPDLSLTPGHNKALHIATTCGSVGCVQLLLEATADMQSLDEDGKTALWHAAQMGNVEIARLLHDAGARQDSASNGGEYPLCIACRNGHLQIVRVLLLDTSPQSGKPAKPNCQQTTKPDAERLLSGSQALHIATKLGNASCAQLLLEADANVHEMDEAGKPALWHAAQMGRIDLVQLLLAAGAGKEVANGVDSPLCVACRNGHLGVVRLLLDAARLGSGESTDLHANPQTVTALSIALRSVISQRGGMACLRLLLEANADVLQSDEDGKSALFHAAQVGSVDICRLLLDAGADRDAASNGGECPLWVACSCGHLGVMNLLLTAGADKNTANTLGITALWTACDGSHFQVAHALLAARADPQIANNMGASLLWIAAARGGASIVPLLHANGANIHCPDATGKTPVWAAACNGHEDILRYLMDHHAEVDVADASGTSALWIAARQGYVDIVRLLARAGANPNILNDTGSSPLWMASSRGHVRMAQALLECHADVNQTQVQTGASPVWIASAKGLLQVVRLLREAGANATADSTGKLPVEIAKQRFHWKIVDLWNGREQPTLAFRTFGSLR
ncbi:ANK3 [Symbiodinium pilosum]|uniref:ANK3 protein n=1 Tax=Symbiodinium pilosum TaxID=2952 RepID=A0A812XFV4_SYMPI|nr:ANK3 [Symbiodinium pilosum]